MQWVGAVSHVAATLVLMVPLLRATWKRRHGRFPYFKTFWKLTLFAMVSWLMALSISVVIDRVALDLGEVAQQDDEVLRRKPLPYGLKKGAERHIAWPVKKIEPPYGQCRGEVLTSSKR